MTQTNKILRALHAGACTSGQIAEAIGASRVNVSVALHRLAEGGKVERIGVLNTDKIGRPYVRWRTRAPKIPSAKSVQI